MGLRYLGNINKPGYNPLASNITTGVNVVQYQGIFTTQQQLQAITTGQWVTDPVFDYSTLLLQADSIANGSQNNTFLDSSTNNFTITRNGNTTQGIFSPFSLQPGEWSNYFDGTTGTSKILRVSGNTVFVFTGTFTFEFWYQTTNTAYKGFYGSTNESTWTADAFGFGHNNGSFTMHINGETAVKSWTVGGAAYDGKWHHVAFVRDASSNIRCFFDGVEVGTAYNNSATLGNATYKIAIGAGEPGGTGSTFSNFVGYLSNFRITKGGALYSSTFTPSPTPLNTTVSAGTVSLLTCQSNRIVDNSVNAFTFLAGNPSVQAFSPFAPQFQYTASVTGGSGYFDDTGDYLSIADNAALQFSATTVFTIEAWIYPTSVASQQGIMVKRGSSGTQEWGLLISSTGTALFGANAGNLTGSTAIKANAWNHIAASSDGTTVSLYLNGAREGTATASSLGVTSSTNAVLIGYQTTTTNPFTGWIASSRVVKGTQIYSGTTYTVPTAPLTAVTNTSLLCNFTNAGILDGTMKNNLETVGNASVSTSVVKYGSGSMYFDGTGDYLFMSPPTTDLFAFSSGDFTIEMWIYRNVLGVQHDIIAFNPTSTNGAYIALYIGTDNLLYLYANSANRITGGTINTGTWYHIALARSGTSTKLFINGTQSGSTYTDTTVYLCGANRPIIGSAGFVVSGSYNGYIDDLRITRGIARYTQNFIPPSVALPRQ